MAIKQNFELMAKYNLWMNQSLYDSCSRLGENVLKEDKGAFFKSILGTLNHILIGDIIWLQRFALHSSHFSALDPVRKLPVPTQLDEMPYHDFESLQQARADMDQIIIQTFTDVHSDDYDHVLRYKNLALEPRSKRFDYLVHHFFNHQTHHRGQVTTLLSQMNIDAGTTDLLALIPDEN